MTTTPLDLSLYPEIDMPPRVLLGPGPSMVSPRVLRVMATPLVGHLDPTFLQLMDRTQSLLRYLFETENKLTVPVSGTGSAAMEAAVANVIEPGDSMLICINGYFGLRMADMAKRYGADVQTIERPWGQVFTPQEVKDALDKHPAKVVFIVHAETSTGALQPLKEISEVVHEHDAIFIVDAVTSLGGMSVAVDANDIDVCYSGGQKCLSCPPGASPITFGQRALDIMDKRTTTVANWYLDMTIVQKYWGQERTYHHTAPISSNYALYEGLRIIAEEGLENRWQCHHENAKLLWDGLQEIGFSMHVAEENRIPSLTTVCIPDDVDDLGTRRSLLAEYNIEIAGGLGELGGKVWRVGLMGYSSRRENVLLLLAALKKLTGR
jgi:alanine-glyoxylate transaminase / serine-glyoxylate transaminase / serine-pyruvate transaminase